MSVENLEKDVFYAIRVGLIALLDGNITINGEDVPVYAAGQQVSGDKYILIENISSLDNSPKTLKCTKTSIQLSLLCKGDDLVGNEIEDMASQVLAIVDPYRGYKLPINANFNVESQKVDDNVIPVFKNDSTTTVYERVIRIQYDINHLLRA